MSSENSKGSILGTVLLVAGTCTGGGMVGMPVITGIGGFIPTLLMTTLIWLCMYATALLLVEATFGLPDGANFFSMATTYLGKIGRYFVIIPFVVFYYLVFISYPAASLPVLSKFLDYFFLSDLPNWLSYGLFGLFFGLVIFAGVRTSDRVNAILMLGLFFTFIWLLAKGLPNIDTNKLKRVDWTFMFLSGPVLFTAFCFHYIIPTLVTYLKRDVADIKKGIFWGLFLSYILYLLWEFLTIGTLKEGDLWKSFEEGGIILESLELLEKNPQFGSVFLAFLFFVMTTALIGMALGIIDFAADGLKWKPEERKGIKRLLLTLLLFVPTMIIGSFFPFFILKTTSYIGGFGFSFLNGVIPVMLAWQARYSLNLTLPQLVPGGKIMILLLGIVTFYIIYLQGIMLIH